jgi:hypothetical protein
MAGYKIIPPNDDLEFAADTARCGFCGRTREQVHKLVRGFGFCGRTCEQVHKLVRGFVGAMAPLICDGCVEAIYLDLGLHNQPLAPKKIFKLASPYNRSGRDGHRSCGRVRAAWRGNTRS